MIHNNLDKRTKVWRSIIILISIIGFAVCFAVLFPQVRRMILDLGAQIVQREASTYQSWLKALFSYAIGGIFLILFFDFCTLTDKGRTLVQKVKKDITDCLSEINFNYFIKPALFMSGIYLLGILTIIRANFLFLDDLGRAAIGYRGWYGWSRYVSELSSIFVHGGTNLTDISPLPQLLAILILSCSSVLLVYIIGNGKITITRLLASIPLGLFPYFLECLSFKFDAPYMSLSILACMVPFLFIAHKKAFIFISIISLLVMCMTYQSISGVYLLIVVILCFRDWNSLRKSNREILSFLGTAVATFCIAMLIFRFFLMKPLDDYASTAMHPFPQMISGVLSNIKNYIEIINQDLGVIWKAGIAMVLLFFITQSISQSSQKKPFSFIISLLVIAVSFILSYGLYILLETPLFLPRALTGFGVFLAILCVYIVAEGKKPAIITVIALNWCFFVFAFSYGNALADQKRYAEFRINLLLHDLSALYPDFNGEIMPIQLKNSIDFAPTIKNIAKQNPVIERLTPKLLAEGYCWENFYFTEYYNFDKYRNVNIQTNVSSDKYIDFDTLNLPVVLDTYYHTIQSDGNRILVVLKR